MSEEQDNPLEERVSWRGRALTAAWLPPPFRPPRALTTQISGLCVTADGGIVLVCDGDGQWQLPGGHPEEGETPEATLAREIREEACAVVERCAYLGCQRVADPEAPNGPTLYYQARYRARVRLEPFAARFETTGRRLVAPSEFLDALSWGRSPIARIILMEGLRLEQAGA